MSDTSASFGGKVANGDKTAVLSRGPWLILFTLLTLALVVGSYAYYRSETVRVSREKYEEIAAIAKLKAERLREWRFDRLSDVESLSRGPMFLRILASWLANRDDAGLEARLRERLEAEAKYAGCTNVILLGPDLHVLMSAKPVSGVWNPVEKQALEKVLSTKSPTLSELFRTPEGIVQIDAVAPILDRFGQVTALPLFRFDAGRVLYPLIQTWPTSSATAETLLIRRDGDNVLFLNDLRHKHNTALSLEHPLSQRDLPAVQAVLGKRGMFLGTDYRDQKVLANLSSVPDSPWFMVAKVDTSEILREARYRGWVAALFCGVGILFAAAAMAYGYRHRQVELYQGLYQSERLQRLAEEVFRTTLYSIGDAVIVAGVDGLVTHMNPVAEKLTGWSETDAQAQPVDCIFHIVNEKSREKVENPVTRVLREKNVVGLANHSVLIAKDGTERPIADSGAPVMDSRGQVRGVVLVFRDQTEERESLKQLEESEEQYRTVADHIYDWEYWTAPDGRLRYCSRSCQRITGYEADEFLKDPSLLDRIVHPADVTVWDRHHSSVANTSEECLFDYRIVGSEGQVVWIAHYCSPVYSREGTYLGRRVSNRDITDRKMSEEALLASKAKLDAALESMTDAVFISDVDGNFVDFNEAFATYHKFRNKEECAKTLAEYPAFLDVFMANGELAPLEQWAVPRALRGETITNAEYSLRRTDTGETWFGSYSFAPIRDRDGAIVGSVVVGRDITEQKRAEEALKLSEARRRLAQQAAKVGTWEWELETGKNFWCEELWRLYGLEPHSCEPSFDSWLTTIHPDDREEAARAVREAASQGTELKAEWRVNAREGTPRWLMARGRPIQDQNGRVLRYGGIVMDITDRKRAEENLKQSEKRYRRLHESMRDAFVQVDMSGHIVDFNTAYQEMLGYEAEELRRLTYQELTPEKWHEREARIVSEDILALGRSAVYEKEYFRKDGTVFPVELRTSLMTDDEGRPIGMWAIVRDITDRKQEEIALLEREKKFRLLYEEAPVPYQSLDGEGNLLEVNAAWLQLLGYTRDEAIGRSFAAFLTPRSRARFKDTFKGFKQAGYLNGIEHEMTCKDGSVIEVSIDGRIARSESGAFAQTHCVFQDITLRKKAERAVQESEQKYRAIFNTASVGIDLLDSHGRFLEVNSTLCHFLGYTPQELRNLSILHVTHPEDTQISRETYEDLVEGRREGYRLDKRYIRKDGSIVWGNVGVSAIRDTEGRYRATVGVIRDITQYKQSEEARIRLEAAVEQAAETVEITDPQATIVYVNPSFEKTTGYAREEAVGKNPHILKSGQHDEAFYRQMWNTISRGEIWRGHFINKKKDGTLFEEDVSISPVRSDSGEIVNYVAVKRDVTREVSLQRQLLQAQKMEAIGTLAGGIAHDFNNILQVGLGYSDLILGDEDLPASLRADVGKINEASKRGADLVQRMLTFSRKTEIKPQPLNLNRRITELRKMLERTIPKMIDIQLHLGENLATIYADPTQIDQILMNLTVNARDAMPEGGRLIIETATVFLDEEYAQAYLEAKSGHHVKLTVTDTGAGMDGETVQHIFEPFYTTKAVGEGTGLGLAMVHGIVQQHGGHIRCFSEPGEGTTFKLYFPALVSTEDSRQTENITMPRGGSETILLVDDDDTIRELGARMLRNSGYTVLTAANGKRALEEFQVHGNEIDLVILDLIMPEMGGKQCLEGLLGMDPAVTVVIASGYSASGPDREWLVTAVKGLVEKPYDMPQMLRVVREVLDAHQEVYA